jgi:hypothetical protein
MECGLLEGPLARMLVQEKGVPGEPTEGCPWADDGKTRVATSELV